MSVGQRLGASVTLLYRPLWLTNRVTEVRTAVVERRVQDGHADYFLRMYDTGSYAQVDMCTSACKYFRRGWDSITHLQVLKLAAPARRAHRAGRVHRHVLWMRSQSEIRRKPCALYMSSTSQLFERQF